MTATTFTISELAKEFDITTRSIRFYEDQNLLEPTRRGQSRIYSRRDRIRLMLILRGKRLGFSLAEIGELFELYDTNANSAPQLRQMLAIVSNKKLALEQQMKDIAVVMSELEAAEERCLTALEELSNAQAS